jgi:hypothetical protein
MVDAILMLVLVFAVQRVGEESIQMHIQKGLFKILFIFLQNTLRVLIASCKGNNNVVLAMKCNCRKLNQLMV